jgi:hypothetical protein
MSKYKNFCFDRSHLVLCEQKEYSRTDSGKSWRSKPDTVTRSVHDGQWYENYVRSVPWFNNRYYGESCRCDWNYTQAGFIPTRCVTSKAGYKKIVYEFRFLSTRAERMASPEQLKTMTDCEKWDMAYSEKYGRLYRFQRTDDAGKIRSAIWNDSKELWV